MSMDGRTKIGMGIGIALLCGVSFFAGNVTAMDSVAKAEADMIAREMKHDADVNQLIADIDKVEEIRKACMNRLDVVAEALQKQQQQETQDKIKEMQKLQIQIEAMLPE